MHGIIVLNRYDMIMMDFFFTVTDKNLVSS